MVGRKIDAPGQGALSSDARPLFTIGHSNHPSRAFSGAAGAPRGRDGGGRALAALLALRAAIPQARRSPTSWRTRASAICFWASSSAASRPGARSRRAASDYATRIREPAFQDGIAQLLAAAEQARVALLCRERDPLECHRLHLICRYLAPERLDIRHILPDGGGRAAERDRAPPAGARRRAAAGASRPRRSRTRCSANMIDGGIKAARICLVAIIELAAGCHIAALSAEPRLSDGREAHGVDPAPEAAPSTMTRRALLRRSALAGAGLAAGLMPVRAFAPAAVRLR